ncbi:MAG: transcription/translation regulatory transformer protein RfaH [Methylococcaceae bacterium]
MHWYLIHTKPQQERRALLNLEQQGYECYLPLISVEKLYKGQISIIEEALFSRYLFIHLDNSQTGKSWGPIRSTLGVCRMVTFGNEPGKIDEQLIKTLRDQADETGNPPKSLFTKGERMLITNGPFIGLEAIYQMPNGENRAMVLINLLNKTVPLKIPLVSLRKING